MKRHDLFELLDVTAPDWQQRHGTLRDVALAVGLLAEYNDYLQTPAGIQYLHSVASVHDYRADNAARKAQIEAEENLALTAGFGFGQGGSLE